MVLRAVGLPLADLYRDPQSGSDVLLRKGDCELPPQFSMPLIHFRKHLLVFVLQLGAVAWIHTTRLQWSLLFLSQWHSVLSCSLRWPFCHVYPRPHHYTCWPEKEIIVHCSMAIHGKCLVWVQKRCHGREDWVLRVLENNETHSLPEKFEVSCTTWAWGI